MRIKQSLFNLAQKAMAESVSINIMEHLARELIDNYDLYERTGFPRNIPIPNRDAANQILKDMMERELFPHYVNLLIMISSDGYMGRRYPVSYLREIVRGFYEQGIIYDQVNKIFVEDSTVRKTRNWGALRNGADYVLALLRLDIAGNSELVRKYPKNVIEATYADFRSIVEKAITKRNGRIWSWEGDGGLVAFYFSHKNKLAALSGIEIVNDLFVYNLSRCRLDSPLEVRLALHNGSCQYNSNMEELKKNDVIKKVTDIESRLSKPNTLTISDNIFVTLPSVLADRFNKTTFDKGISFYRYEIKWEK